MRNGEDHPAEGEATESRDVTADLPARVLAPGQVLGERYRIGRLLGRGGMGEVWQATDLKLRVEVALKALHGDLFSSERGREMLRREVRAARLVVSPNVCRIFDLIEIDGHELVSMEFVNGQTLCEVLREHAPLELKQAQDIASQFLAGLEAIHAAGLVHRDVKPENIMLTRAGRVVVMDFGLARPELEVSNTLAGTPAYMSPEQAAGDHVDARADVYAAGVVLAEMVSPDGVRNRDSRQSVWEGVRAEPPRVPETPWAAVIRKAVAKDRERRQHTARTLIRELEDVTLRVEGAEDLHPYPGLASFTAADAEYFFGREVEVETFWERLEQPRLLAVIGPSGAGKTSFLRAGVLPAAPVGWGWAICTPGTEAIASLGRAMVRELAGDVAIVERLLAFDDPEVAVEVVAAWRAKHDHVMLVVDQFEELFTLNPPEVQRQFTQLLARLVLEADVAVVLSLRDDFLMRCRDYEALQPLFSELTALPTLAGSALRRALVQPAMRCGYRFEDDELIHGMLAEVDGERGALPLLAFAAAQLWKRRDRTSGEMTRAAYETIGGVGGALARHAEATIDRIGADRVPLVRELFRNLVTAEGTRAVRDQDDLLSVFGESEREAAEEVLRELVEARLLTTYEIHDDDREPTRRVEIIHESLLTNWPRLVRWQTQDVDAAQLRDQLRQAARTWDEHERSDDLLWTGSAFREFALWQERYPGGLSASEQAFADAMARHAARRRRRRRLGVAAVLVVAAATTAIFGGLWRRSELETRRAEGARLLTIARLELEKDSTAALAWATTSLELADTPEARRFAFEALWDGPTRFDVEPTEGRPHPENIVFSPDGRFLAANTNSSDQLLVWTDEGAGPRMFGPTTKTRFLGDVWSSTTKQGKPVIVQRVGAKFRLWSLPDFEVLRDFSFAASWTLLAPGKFVVFSEKGDGYLVQSWPYDGGESTTHGLWQPPGGAEPRIDATGESLLFTRDGELVRRPLEHLDSELHDEVLVHDPANIVWPVGGVARDRIPVLDAGGIVRIWSSDPDPLHPLAVLRGLSPGFQSDVTGTLLYAGSDDKGALRIWDTTAPPDAEPLVIPQLPESPTIDPGGSWLAGEHGGRLSFWPLGECHPRVLKGDSSQITALTFLGDGSRLVSASRRSIRLWPLRSTSGELAHKLVEGSPNRNGVAANPSGTTLLIARWFYVGVHRMELSTGSLKLLIPKFDGIVWTGMAFSPDGRWAAAAPLYAFTSSNMVMHVWDTATWSERTFDLRDAQWSGTYDGEYLGGVGQMQFTSDGKLLTSGSGGIRLWNLETGEAEWVVRTVDDRWMFMSADRNGRHLLTAETVSTPRGGEAVEALTFHDRVTGSSRAITSHGESVGAFFALDPTATIVVTSVPGEDVIQVGSADGSVPYLLYGRGGGVTAIAISPDGRWIASGHEDGTIRLWPMPDVSRPPLHTLPHDKLIAKLKTLTNLRVVRNPGSADDWQVKAAPFPGWKYVPRW